MLDERRVKVLESDEAANRPSGKGEGNLMKGDRLRYDLIFRTSVSSDANWRKYKH